MVKDKHMNGTEQMHPRTGTVWYMHSLRTDREGLIYALWGDLCW